MSIKIPGFHTQQGRRSGYELGRASGQLTGCRGAAENILTMRFGELTPSERKRIACADMNTLISWIQKAMIADNIDDVFQG